MEASNEALRRENQELREQLAQLLEENKRLTAENKRLLESAALNTTQPVSAVSNTSAAATKGTKKPDSTRQRLATRRIGLSALFGGRDSEDAASAEDTNSSAANSDAPSSAAAVATAAANREGSSDWGDSEDGVSPNISPRTALGETSPRRPHLFSRFVRKSGSSNNVQPVSTASLGATAVSTSEGSGRGSGLNSSGSGSLFSVVDRSSAVNSSANSSTSSLSGFQGSGGVLVTGTGVGTGEVSMPQQGRAQTVTSSGLSVTVLSVQKVGRNSFFMLAIKHQMQGGVTMCPRRFEDVRTLHATLSKAYGDSMPDLPRRMGVSDKDQQASVQQLIDGLLVLPDIETNKQFLGFLDPAVNPSYYAVSEFLKPVKKGKLSLWLPASKLWRPHFFVLLESLYVYRTEDDGAPSGVLPLVYVTLELARDDVPGTTGIPAQVFKIVDLAENQDTFIGCETTKEVGEWILALREAKVNKMGLGYWVKAATGGPEDEANNSLNGGAQNSGSHIESLTRARKEQEVAFPVFRQWLEEPEQFAIGRKLAEMAEMLHAEPIEVDFDHESAAFDNISFRDGEEGSVLSGATTLRWIQLLLDPDHDPEFVEMAILTYQLYLSTEELFLTVADRFIGTDDYNVRERCAAVFARWIDLQFAEYSRSETMAQLLLELVTLNLEDQSPSYIAIKDTITSHVIRDVRSEKTWLKNAPKPILPDMYHRTLFDFIDLHPTEVARQLTILEFDLFAAIEGRELLNQSWNGDRKLQDAPNVTAAISRFNQMSGWVTSLLMKVRSLKPRAALLRRFVDIADACIEFNNFNSAFEIVSGLQTAAVLRLTDTWELLPEDARSTFQGLKDLMQTRRNWENYRSRLANCAPPVLPYLGLYLTDLTMIDEACKKSFAAPGYPNVKLLNMERALKIAKVVAEVKVYQSVKYCLRSVGYFQEYLSRLDQLTEDECYEISLQLQPREKK